MNDLGPRGPRTQWTASLSVSRRWETAVRMGPGSLASLRDLWSSSVRQVVLVADRTVLRLHGSVIRPVLQDVAREVRVVEVAPGEKSKSRRTVARIEDAMVAARVRSDAVIVALGGGMTTDLACFVAATYLRGIDLVNLPTTVVGAVDAGLGGKTGIDTTHGKNLIGTFHWPLAVVVDTDLLRTLPQKEVLEGLAEMVKHGVIADPGLLAEMEAAAESLAPGAPPDPELLWRAAQVKLDVVRRDPFEAGLRRTLNFGHTVGHAVEAASGYRVRHGEAVAIGLAVEARVATRRTGLPPGDADRLVALLETLGLPVRPPCTFKRALPYLLRDKKDRGTAIRMALPRALGVMEPAGDEYALDVPSDLLEACWNG